MDNGTLFPAIIDPGLRLSILEALLRLEVMIPTIETFHVNVNYFEIAVRILKAHLFPNVSKNGLCDAMLSHWSPPKSFQVEVEEEKFMDVDVPVKYQGYLSCIIVVLYALRHFPSLSSYSPRLDKRKRQIGDDSVGMVDASRKMQLQNLASHLGFRTANSLHDLCALTMKPHDWKSSSELNMYGEDIRYRSGRPFASSFKYIEQHLFLSNLSNKYDENALKPSVMFVQQDIIKGFLGPGVNSLKWSNGKILFDENVFEKSDNEYSRVDDISQDTLRPPVTKSSLQYHQPRDSPPRDSPPRGPGEGEILSPIDPENADVSPLFTFNVIERHSMGERLPMKRLFNIQDVKNYLLWRSGWVMTVRDGGIIKTIRYEHICEYMMSNPKAKYVIVSSDYIERFINNQFKS